MAWIPTWGAVGERLGSAVKFLAIPLTFCAAWVVLSQVPVIRWKDSTTFFGPDGALAFLEEKTIDARLVARGTIPSPIKIRYVNVDTGSIETIGNFPWNRVVFAMALDALFERGKIRAAGMDFVFSNAGLPQLGNAEAREGNLSLWRSVEKNQNVVLAAAYVTESGLLDKPSARTPLLFRRRNNPADADPPEKPDYPVAGLSWANIGLINTVDGPLRWIPVFARTKDQTYFTMAVQLALVYSGLDASAIEILPDRLLARDADGRIVYDIPLTLGQLVEPNWFSPWQSEENPRDAIALVLAYDQMAREGTDAEKADAARFFEKFAGAVVLIGPTDPLLHDISEAPMSGASLVPRVSLHGNLLKTIVSGRYLVRPPVWANCLLICGLGLGTAWLSVMRNRFSGLGKPIAGVLVVGYVGAAFALFAKAGVLVPIVAPVGAALTCTFVSLLRQLAVEERQRWRIRKLFGSYVSADVVNEMVDKNTPPQTGGAEVEITAFFSDIVSFSSIAEVLSATDLVRLMCQYLAECTSAVIGEQGTLDKYVGDAIIAMFGAPLACRDHAASACRAALALQAAQARLRERWSAEGCWPEVAWAMKTRVGLHTGVAIVGNIGSELRFNYTMMGDTVNLTQRVEAAGSHYGTSILVTGHTRAAAEAADPALVFLPIDRVLVRGRSRPVELFELLGCGDDSLALYRRHIEAYADARRLYLCGEWSDACKNFLAAALEDPLPRTKSPASVMADRCRKFSGRPPVENLAFRLASHASLGDGYPVP